MITDNRPWYGYNLNEDGPTAGGSVLAATAQEAAQLLAFTAPAERFLDTPINYISRLLVGDRLRFQMFDIRNATSTMIEVGLDVTDLGPLP